MQFKIHVTSTKEVDAEQWRSLIINLEKFVDSKLSKKSFGSSVDKFHYGFEIFSFNGEFDGWFQQTKDIRKYSWQNKYLLSVGQIDWDIYKNKDKKGQLKIVLESILDSIRNLKQLKKKPKDFDFVAFESSMIDILNQYENY